VPGVYATENYLLNSLYDYLRNRPYQIVEYKCIEPNYEKLRLDYGSNKIVINREFNEIWADGIKFESINDLINYIDSKLQRNVTEAVSYKSMIFDDEFVIKYHGLRIDDIDLTVLRGSNLVEKVVIHNNAKVYYEFRMVKLVVISVIRVRVYGLNVLLDYSPLHRVPEPLNIDLGTRIGLNTIIELSSTTSRIHSIPEALRIDFGMRYGVNTSIMLFLDTSPKTYLTVEII
jgi:hypothetical protein